MTSEETKKKHPGRKVFLIILLALIAAAGYLVFTMVSSGKEGPRKRGGIEQEEGETVFAVTTTQAVSGQIRDHLDVNGDIVAASSVSVYPDTSGKLTRLFAGLGDYVRKNQIIAEVDPSRPGMTYSANPVKAAISGTITSLPIDIGSTVSPQLPVAEIGELSQLQVRTFIPERFISRLSMGMEAGITLEAYPGEIFKAVVTEISPIVDPVSRTLEITMDLATRDPRIKAGMYAEISLITQVKEEIVKIPSDCILDRFGEKFVFVLDTEDSVSKRLIREGISIDGISEIVEGLKQGESMVYQGQTLLDDQARVKVIRSVQPLR